MVSEPAVAGELPVSDAPAAQAERGVFDKWLVWGIALSSVALPALSLAVISSLVSGSPDLRYLREAAGRGEFLIPDVFLLIECCRRLLREVSPRKKFFQWIKGLVVFTCAVAALSCLIGSVFLVTAATDKTAHMAMFMSGWSAMIGFLMGTISVAVKDGEQ